MNANIRTNPDSRLQTRAARADAAIVSNSKAIRAALATAALARNEYSFSEHRVLASVVLLFAGILGTFPAGAQEKKVNFSFGGGYTQPDGEVSDRLGGRGTSISECRWT